MSTGTIQTTISECSEPSPGGAYSANVTTEYRDGNGKIIHTVTNTEIPVTQLEKLGIENGITAWTTLPGKEA